ncbi:MAG: GYD domain-containing protein [Gemmatimonadales bacterium]
MATYISLFRYTQQGITSIKQAPGRIDAARQAYRALGAELKALYLVMGQYDFVALVEAPDDTVAAKAALALGSRGNVSSETLRAFTEDEFRNIVAGLP